MVPRTCVKTMLWACDAGLNPRWWVTVDETDLALLLILIRDSRTPYSTMAKRLKMSIPSVHKRIAALQDAGAIKRYIANISWPHLNAVPVMVWGLSGVFPLRDAVEKLGKHDATRIVIQGSENSLYIQAHLRDVQALGPYVAHCRKVAAMPSLTVGIESDVRYGSNPPYETPDPAELDPIDYRILWALHDDARKPIADVCKELRVSPKTVRTRLRRMRDRGLAEFYTQLQMGTEAGVLAFFMLHLRPDVEPSAFRGRLISELGPRVIWSTPLGNEPTLLPMLMWSPTTVVHEELVDRLSADEAVEKVIGHISTHFDFFATWRDELLREKAVANGNG